MTPAQIELQVRRGAKFIRYDYCISLVVISFSRVSKPVFVPVGGNVIAAGWKYLLLSALLGWWGFPFGIFFTIKSLWVNLRGGRDVTDSVMAQLLYSQRQR